METLQKRKFSVVDFLKGDISTLITLILMIVLFSVLNPYFFTVRNLMSIGSYESIQGTMAAGLTVCMLFGGMDVSQFSMAGLSGMLLGILYNAGCNDFVTLLLCMALGVVVGAINAFLICNLKISPMIATMGMQFILRGFCYISTGGTYVYLHSPVFDFIGNGKIFGVVPFCLIIMAVIYVILWYVMKYTKFGRNVYACGGNQKAAQLAGINVYVMRYKAHMISSLCAAIGGIIMTCQNTASMCNAGEGSDMDCIAAVTLGGLALAGGKGKITGTLIGITILSVLFNGMTMLNVQVYWQRVMRGGILLLAVFIDSLRNGLLKKD